MSQWANAVSTYSTKGSNARRSLKATVSVSVKYRPQGCPDPEVEGESKLRVALATYIQPDILITSTDLFDDIAEPESITCDGKGCIRLEYPTSLRQLLLYSNLVSSTDGSFSIMLGFWENSSSFSPA